MTLRDITNEDKNTMASTLESELASFTGTTRYYQNFLGMLYTDGVHFLAERAGAYWLIDAIASWQPHVRMVEQKLQLWELKVDDNHSAELTVRRDTCEPPFARQRIEDTDFPLKYLKLYVRDDVLLLPSEH